MFKTAFFISIVFLAGFVYFFTMNPQEVDILLWKGKEYHTHLAIIVFGAFAVGAVIVSLAAIFKDTKRKVREWSAGRQARRKERSRELYSFGVENLLKGNYVKAKNIFTEVMEKDPSYVKTYVRMSEIFQKEENYDEAVSLLKKALSVSPHNLEATFNLIECYEKTNQVELALSLAKELFGIDKFNFGALRKIRALYQKQKKFEEAYGIQKEIIKLTKEPKWLMKEENVLVGLKYEFGKNMLDKNNFEKAESIFKDIIKNHPSFTPAKVRLGEVYYASGKPLEAISVWEDAFKSDRSPVFLTRIEDVHLMQGMPDRIIKFYKGLINETPGNRLLKFFLGKLYVRLEMVDDAISVLEELESGGLEIPEIHILLGEAYRKRNMHEKAINQYKKALNIKNIQNMPYHCVECGTEFEEWQGYCPDCERWNVVKMKYFDEPGNRVIKFKGGAL